jgi:hypothetical protein
MTGFLNPVGSGEGFGWQKTGSLALPPCDVGHLDAGSSGCFGGCFGMITLIQVTRRN